MRLLRTIAFTTLGFWGGLLAGAALVKRALPSRGGTESDEVSLVAVLDGVAVRSRASAFRGGSALSWFGGVALDLREARLAPGAHLEVTSVFGGVAIRVPEGWKVDSNVKALAGGVAIKVPEPAEPNAPTLTIDGLAAFGGVAIEAKPPAHEHAG